jgi:hypothetical protein
MSLIDENSSMKASLSPVLERMIEHAPHIYIMIPLPKIYLFSSTPWPRMEVNALMKWDQMALATHSASVVDALRLAIFYEMLWLYQQKLSSRA